MEMYSHLNRAKLRLQTQGPYLKVHFFSQLARLSASQAATLSLFVQHNGREYSFFTQDL